MLVATYTLHRFENNDDAQTFIRLRLAEGMDAQWSPFVGGKVERKDGKAMACDVLVKDAN